MAKAKYRVINLAKGSTTSFGSWKRGNAVYKNGDIVEFEREFAQSFVQVCEKTGVQLGTLEEVKGKAE